MSDQQAHTIFSPSSAEKWTECIGALAMEHGIPSDTSDYAEEGTAGHELASWALNDGAYYCMAYQGRITSNGWEVTEQMCEDIQIYVDAIRARVDEYYQSGALNVKVMIENRVVFSELIGIPDQFGTSDAIFLVEWPDGTALIGVEDLKFGYSIVHAQRNKQLMVYALAALEQYGLIANFTRARMVIHQPRREHVSDWEISITELKEFGQEVRKKAQEAYKILQHRIESGINSVPAYSLVPGEKQCQWCKRKGDCPALAKWVEDTIGAEFEDLTAVKLTDSFAQIEKLEDVDRSAQLGRLLRARPLLDIFVKGILGAAEAFMFSGGVIEDWKVVAGKKGHRKFSDEKEAEEVMKSMRLKQDQMYSMKLRSPTQMEKELKGNPVKWKRLQTLIVQREGQPSIAESSDKRASLVITKPEDDFDVVNDEGETLA